MTTKTITVTENAYRTIANMKLPGESFSDLFNRLGTKVATGEEIFGILSGNIDAKRKSLEDVRKRLSTGLEKRRNVFAR